MKEHKILLLPPFFFFCSPGFPEILSIDKPGLELTKAEPLPPKG